MTKTLPTEESLGLSPTDEELATSVAPADDDVSSSDDDDAGTPELAQPGAEKKAEPKAEEQPADPQKAPEKPADPPKMVDVRAVQEARAEAREARERANLLESRWNQFLEAQTKPATPAPTVPGPEDPMGRLNWAADQVAEMRAAQERTATEQAEQQREEQVYQQAFVQVDTDYRLASQADPTVQEAYSALRESQGKELLALGYSIPEAQAELNRIERQHVLYVAQRGLNIADHIKNLAQVRGWQPKGPDATVAAQPAKTDLAAVAAAQQRHQSLSDAPGGETVAVLDAKALAKMSDKDFKAWMSKKGNEAKFDEIMGA